MPKDPFLPKIQNNRLDLVISGKEKVNDLLFKLEEASRSFEITIFHLNQATDKTNKYYYYTLEKFQKSGIHRFNFIMLKSNRSSNNI